MSAVKSYQHRKALGNARAAVRTLYVPILRDISGLDIVGGPAQPFGPERQAVPATITYNPLTGAGMIAVGRLEQLSASAIAKSTVLLNREAYRLYWLPFSWIHAAGDYHGNPQRIGPEVNPAAPRGLDFIQAGIRVWIVLDANASETLAGRLAWEFIVASTSRDGTTDLVEYEATVYRSEGAAPRTVVVT